MVNYLPHRQLTTSSEKQDLELAIEAKSEREFNEWVIPPLLDCFYLTGATASGKTPLALSLAERLDAEIISLDSMALYCGMDIGTAKPSLPQREAVPHHMIDIVEPTESFSVSTYVTRVHELAEEIRERGKKVLFCGGTPLYLKSLIRGLFLGPEADWEFRNSVEEDLKKFGEQSLLDRLNQVDPLLSHKLHPHDHRRIIRALEVAKITGKPLSHWQQQFETPAPAERCAVAVLKIDRAWLHERINRRVEEMIREGLITEVQGLLDKHGQLGRTAAQAVGYREVLQHLQDSTPIEKTIELIRAHTRQFARRQEIWFRGLEELHWTEVAPDRAVDETLQEIETIFQSTQADS
ncbi:MAG: tRNA (adenosine(37)-N6)-dimethylallyltransferase MiaA [Pirellulaceae bacterium]